MNRVPAGQARRPSRRTRVAGVVILAVLAALILWRPPALARLQSAWFDALQVVAPRKIESMPATIVAIDEKSLAALGQWPWPRTVLASLIRAIAIHQPAAIGIDILMPEADRLSPQRLADQLRSTDPGLAERLDTLPSNDEELAGAIARASVVLAVAAQVDSAQGMSSAAPFIVTNTRPGADTAALAASDIPRYGGVVASIGLLDSAAAGHGVISVVPSGGVVRRIPLVVNIGGTLAAALSIEMLRVALGVPALRMQMDGSSVARIAAGDIVAITEADGAARIHF